MAAKKKPAAKKSNKPAPVTVKDVEEIVKRIVAPLTEAFKGVPPSNTPANGIHTDPDEALGVGKKINEEMERSKAIDKVADSAPAIEEPSDETPNRKFEPTPVERAFGVEIQIPHGGGGIADRMRKLPKTIATVRTRHGTTIVQIALPGMSEVEAGKVSRATGFALCDYETGKPVDQ